MSGQTQNPQWSDISNSDSFNSLQPEQQESVRNTYFDKVIAPNAPPEHLDTIKQAYDAKTAPNQENFVQRAGKYETQNLQQAGQELMSPNFADKASDPWYKKAVAFIGQKAGAVGSALASPFVSTGEAAIEPIAPAIGKEVAHVLSPESSDQETTLVGNKLKESTTKALGSALGSSVLATAGTSGQLGNFRSVQEIRNNISNQVTPALDEATNNSRNFLTNNASGAKIEEQIPQGFDTLAKANKGTGWFAKENDPSIAGMEANQAISKQYGADIADRNAKYEVLNDPKLASEIQVPELYSKLNKLTGYLEDKIDLGTDEARALTELKEITSNLQGKYGKSGTPDIPDKVSSVLDENGQPIVIPGRPGTPAVAASKIQPSDLIDIKSGINSLLRSNKFTTAGQAQLIEAKTYVQDALDKAATAYPQFGQALKAAEDANARVGIYKASNLSDIWNAHDYMKWKEGQNSPSKAGYDADTVSRAGKFLDALNSGDEGKIKSIIDILPQDQAVQVLHDAILRAKTVTPSMRNVVMGLIGRPGAYGTLGTPLSAPEVLKNLLGAINPYQKPSPLVNLANRATPKSDASIASQVIKPTGVAGLSYLAGKSFIRGFGQQNKQQQDKKNEKPQSNNSPIDATTNALEGSKKNDSFQLSDLNPISDAQAFEIKANADSPIYDNVRNFQVSRDGPALTQAMKTHGVNATEMMTLINAESSVKNIGNGYAQMTPTAWRQSEQVSGKKLDRNNPQDYAEAAVSYYKWTANQVKKILGTSGQPAMKDVYPAYNAGVQGFKALHEANPNADSTKVVPKEVSENNPYFYFNKDGSHKTVDQTLRTYKSFIQQKMEEYSPAKAKGATKLALLNSAKSKDITNEPDMSP